MRQFALVAVGADGGPGGCEEVVAAAEGSPSLGVAPFWIRHCGVPFDQPIGVCAGRMHDEAKLGVTRAGGDLPAGLFYLSCRAYLSCEACLSCRAGQLLCQAGKCIPPRVSRSVIAVAFCLIQILSTVLAESLAVRLAERSCGKGEEHLFAHDVFEQKPAFFIIPDLGLFFGDGALFPVSVDGFGAEDEVEVAGEVFGDGLDAAGAEEFEVAVVDGAQANIFDDFFMAAALDDEVSLAFDGERANLADVGGVLEGVGGDGLVEMEGLVLEVDGFDEHGTGIYFLMPGAGARGGGCEGGGFSPVWWGGRG